LEKTEKVLPNDSNLRPLLKVRVWTPFHVGTSRPIVEVPKWNGVYTLTFSRGLKLEWLDSRILIE